MSKPVIHRVGVRQVPLRQIGLHPVTVTLDQRTGVYVTWHKCLECQLEYATFSWVAGREAPYCPECGRDGAKLSETDLIDDSREFDIQNPLEIFALRRVLASATRAIRGDTGPAASVDGPIQ